MSQATLVDGVNGVVFGLWWIHQSDGSDLPVPQMQSEIISRVGLDHAVRRIGKFGGEKFQANCRTDLPNRQYSEAMFAALNRAQDNYIPLGLNVRRPDGTWFNYSSVGVAFMIVSERGSPGISFIPRRVLGVVGGYYTFPNSKIVVDFSLQLLPVLI